MATNRGKIHGGKSVLNIHVASVEFGEITRGETTRFYRTVQREINKQLGCLVQRRFQNNSFATV